MTDTPGRTVPDGDVPKIRRCLRCKEKFSSEWSGERICSRCKRSNSWKNGVPPRTASFDRPTQK